MAERRNSNHFNELANETDHSLRAVFVWSRQIDFVAENDQPSGELHGGEHNTIWSASVRSFDDDDAQILPKIIMIMMTKNLYSQ